MQKVKANSRRVKRPARKTRLAKDPVVTGPPADLLARIAAIDAANATDITEQERRLCVEAAKDVERHSSGRDTKWYNGDEVKRELLGGVQNGSRRKPAEKFNRVSQRALLKQVKPIVAHIRLNGPITTHVIERSFAHDPCQPESEKLENEHLENEHLQIEGLHLPEREIVGTLKLLAIKKILVRKHVLGLHGSSNLRFQYDIADPRRRFFVTRKTR